MINVEIFLWFQFLLLVVLSTLTSLGLSLLMPWSESAKKAHMHIAAGVLLAPFLIGILTVLVLFLLPRVAYTSHLYLIYTFLSIGALFYFIRRSGLSIIVIKKKLVGDQLIQNLLKTIFIILILILLYYTINIPLIKNDPLEYAIVGREIFYARTLSIYPLLNAESNVSGFFAPWTHPPLYVSLIYLMSALQNHADTPGLMRLISPWFFLSSLYAMISLGRLYNNMFGLLCGLMFIGIPLLFFNSAGAHIDSLIAGGTTMLLLALIGLDKTHNSFPIFLGLVVGLSLWTHSLAIILIPFTIFAILLHFGFHGWSSAIKILFITTIVSFLLATGPYINNYLKFGKIISDNNKIFALPELAWSDYILYSRGISDFFGKIGGLLNGWFSISSYGFIFWMGLAGCFIFLSQQRVEKRFAIIVISGLKQIHIRYYSLWLSIFLICTYFVGNIILISFGINNLIQNGRYILIIIPLICLLAAYFNYCILRLIKNIFFILKKKYPSFKIIAILSICLIFLLQTFLIIMNMVYNEKNFYDSLVYDKLLATLNNRPSKELNNSIKIEDKILNNKLYKIIKSTPKDSVIFSMRPSEMYYADRKMMSYLDYRLVSFYQERDPLVAFRILKSLGVSHILMTSNTFPVFYNSGLKFILADPRFSRLVYNSNDTVQLYELRSSVQISQKKLKKIDLLQEPYIWTNNLFINILNIFSLKINNEFYDKKSIENTFAYFTVRKLVLNKITKNLQNNLLIEEPGEYIISLNLAGEGYVTLWMEKNSFFATGKTLLGDFALSPTKPKIEFLRRVKFEDKNTYFSLSIEHKGSRIKIEKIILEQLSLDPKTLN
jgi:hypothetical protein